MQQVKEYLESFKNDKKNIWCALFMSVSVMLFALSYIILPGRIGTQLSSNRELMHIMNRKTVMSATFLFTLSATFMYGRNGYLFRLLVLAIFGNVFALYNYLTKLVFHTPLNVTENLLYTEITI